MKFLFKILIFISFVGKAQNSNLVPNYSFEDTIICNLGYLFPNIKEWYSPTSNTPKAYHICTDNAIMNFADEYNAHSGYGRAVIYLYFVPSPPAEQRDYIAVKLKQSLAGNKKYCVDFYAKPSKLSKYGCNSMGVYFGVGSQFYNTLTIPPIFPQSNLILSTAIVDTGVWYHYVDIYNATGGETDIVLGNFLADTQLIIPIINSNPNFFTDGADFIIDDVSVHEMSINSGDTAVTCPQNMITTIGETNTDTAFKSYYWYDSAGVLFDSVDARIQVQPLTNTFYIQEKRMCGQSLWDTVYVKLDTVCPPEPTTPEIELIIPNVFSPNGDGINDTWKIELPATYAFQSIGIYDRWGVQVATIPDLTANQNDTLKVIQWFGRTTSGIACSEGVYYYIAEIKNSKGEIEKHKGYISLFK